MPDNQSVERNHNSSLNTSGYNIEEAIRRLRIHTNEKDDETGSTGYPDRPGEPDCMYYLRTGMCGYGDNCRFNHPTYNVQVNHHENDLPERVGAQDCVYFIKTGTCKYGSTCKYNHPRDRHDIGPIVLNIIGLPMRQGQKPCSHYLRTGLCKFGVTCKFHHPQPALNGSSQPLYGPLPYAPSVAPHHIGGAPHWSYSSPQAYLPIVLPSSGPTQGWNPYIGNMNPVLSTNALTSVDQNYPTTQNSQLPERPGEPECRYFMNNGACKYGSNCKYHHPKENMVQYIANSMSPFGLPLRPGLPVCSYYSLYGMCKYGLDCKFDHPLVVYSYGYNSGLTMVDPLFTNGGMNSPTIRSSESPKSNGKLCTDDSCGENVGSSSHSSSQNHSD